MSHSFSNATINREIDEIIERIDVIRNQINFVKELKYAQLPKTYGRFKVKTVYNDRSPSNQADEPAQEAIENLRKMKKLAPRIKVNRVIYSQSETAGKTASSRGGSRRRTQKNPHK
jgi:hypothetical protein